MPLNVGSEKWTASKPRAALKYASGAPIAPSSNDSTGRPCSHLSERGMVSAKDIQSERIHNGAPPGGAPGEPAA